MKKLTVLAALLAAGCTSAGEPYLTRSLTQNALAETLAARNPGTENADAVANCAIYASALEERQEIATAIRKNKEFVVQPLIADILSRPKAQACLTSQGGA